MISYYVFASACEELRRNGIVPVGYAFTEHDQPAIHWGYGAHAEPQVMVAEAVIRICSKAEFEDKHPIEIVLSCPGIAT